MTKSVHFKDSGRPQIVFLPGLRKLFNHGRLVLELPLPDPPLHLPRGHAALLRQGLDVVIREVFGHKVLLQDRVWGRGSVN